MSNSPTWRAFVGSSAAATLSAVRTGRAAGTDVLPSWNDTAPRRAIIAFAERVVAGERSGGIAPGPRFGMLIHHTDAEREYAYDRHSHVGRLDKALDAAAPLGWTVLDMRADWRRVFPFQ